MPVVSVGTGATLLADYNSKRHSVHLRNKGTGTVFFGNRADVSTSDYDGYLEEGDAFTYDRWDGIVYGIVASGTSDVAVEEEV